MAYINCDECYHAKVCLHNRGDVVVCKYWQPTADVVEVVRCKDCKHYDDVGECEAHPYDGRFGVNYFCADGERRDT